MGDAVEDGSVAGFRCGVERGTLDVDAVMLALSRQGSGVSLITN